MKVEIDLEKELVKAIDKEVTNHLKVTSIYPYMRDIIKREVKATFDIRLNNYKEVISRLNGRITNLQAKIEKIENKIK